MRFKLLWTIVLIVLILIAAIIVIMASCTGNSVDYENTFEVYGRVVYCPPIFLLVDSRAEFYLFTRGQPIRDAVITIEADTIALTDSAAGFYSKPLQIAIGDTLQYSINSSYGSVEGSIVIPDTVTLLYPEENAMLVFGENIQAIWHSSYTADGYFIYLENQNGLVNEVTELQSDTSVTISGENMSRLGQDRIWVESIKGDFIRLQAPNSRALPLGVVGAAANVHNVNIVILSGAASPEEN
jgi:hypothetical protein